MSGAENVTGNSLSNQVSGYSSVMQTIAIVFMLIFNGVGNTSVLSAIRQVPRLRKQVSNIVVASLAVSDFLVIPQMMFRLILLHDSEAAVRVCNVFSGILVVLLYVSILHLATVSCDRYVAVIYPLRYHSIVTARRVRVILALIWFLPVFSVVIVSLLRGDTEGPAFRSNTIGCPVHWEKSSPFHQGHLIFNMVLFEGVPFSLTILAYGRIAWVSYYQSRRVEPVIQVNEENTIVVERQRHMKKEMKWARTLGIVVSAFVISYGPTCTLSIIRVKRGPDFFPYWLVCLALMIMFLNSALNPVIYSFRSREFREAFWRLLGRQPVLQVSPREMDGTHAPSYIAEPGEGVIRGTCHIDHTTEGGMVIDLVSNGAQLRVSGRQSTDSRPDMSSHM